MTLKTPEINPSFGLNGSHKARKPNAGKGARLCPPPDISKANGGMKLRPITTAHDRLNGHNILVEKDLRNGTFSKIHSVRTEYTKYNRPSLQLLDPGVLVERDARQLAVWLDEAHDGD